MLIKVKTDKNNYVYCNIKIAVLTFLEYNAKGHKNRIKGKDLQNILNVNYKLISQAAIELKNQGYPIFNINGYFYATPEDRDVLKHREVLVNQKFAALNREAQTIKRLLLTKEEALF